MAENKMKQVAELLGVEMGVPFKVKNYNGTYLVYNPYVFKDGGLYDRDGDLIDGVLIRLLRGKYEIEKPILDKVKNVI